MNKISCFLPYAGKEQVEKTVNSLQATGLIEEIRLITTDATLESLPDCEILFVDMPYSSATLKAIANAAKGEYTLLYTKETTLEMGMFALERMIHILEDSSAGMVYADHYQIADGKQSNAPVIDYQFGSLRDDFNFGSINGSTCRILQHRNRFNVRSIHFFHLTIRLFYPINYKQWFLLPIFQRKSFLTYPQWIFLKNSVCLQLQMTCFI